MNNLGSVGFEFATTCVDKLEENLLSLLAIQKAIIFLTSKLLEDFLSFVKAVKIKTLR